MGPREYEAWLNQLAAGALVDLELRFPHRIDTVFGARVVANEPPAGAIVVITALGERLSAGKIGCYAGSTVRGQILPPTAPVRMIEES